MQLSCIRVRCLVIYYFYNKRIFTKTSKIFNNTFISKQFTYKYNTDNLAMYIINYSHLYNNTINCSYIQKHI